MTVLHKLQGFFEELRLNGVPITPSNAMDCCQAVLQIDWILVFLSIRLSFSSLFRVVYNRP
jgi:hypothetical protein